MCVVATAPCSPAPWMLCGDKHLHSWFGCTMQLKLEIRPKARAAVSKVLLVGGATRMPAVKRFLTNMTGLTPEDNDAVDPDEAVALGAAVQVSVRQGMFLAPAARTLSHFLHACSRLHGGSRPHRLKALSSVRRCSDTPLVCAQCFTILAYTLVMTVIAVFTMQVQAARKPGNWCFGALVLLCAAGRHPAG